MRDRKFREKKAVVVEDTVQMVTFQVGAEEYGLDITSITEVIRPLKITPLPRMPEFVEGVINLRGAIIPIVDLRKRFALPANTENRKTVRMMIIRGAIYGASGTGKEPLGLVVDSVQEVLHVPKKNIDQTPQAARGEHSTFVAGMGKVGERLIILIDITRILSQEERSALVEAKHAGY